MNLISADRYSGNYRVRNFSCRDHFYTESDGRSNFKWIKQHLKIKSFYGTSQNAVYCQIWIALCTYLLIAIAKKRYNIEQSLYLFSQICGITPFEKMLLNELFSKSSLSVPIDDFPNLFSCSDF